MANIDESISNSYYNNLNEKWLFDKKKEYKKWNQISVKFCLSFHLYKKVGHEFHIHLKVKKGHFAKEAWETFNRYIRIIKLQLHESEKSHCN